MTKKKVLKPINPNGPLMTQEEAQLLCDAHEVGQLLRNEEETELLEQHNPGLLTAYEKLWAIAGGDDA